MASTRTALAPTGGEACTAEAKLCPDGSAVGRTGPNCEFAECPSTGSISLEAHIGQTVSGLGVNITPLAVLQDSRCPIDVQCIQAGTVKMQARLVSGLGTGTQEFTIGQPILTEAETITLADVSPQPTAGVKIKDSDYIFRFEIAKRAGNAVPPVSGVRGTISLGPTCPVMRDPPDPQCADKPYATSIVARGTEANANAYVGRSNTSGAFELTLPPGSYTLTAGGDTMLPRCNPVVVTVAASGYTTTTISCDTGIR